MSTNPKSVNFQPGEGKTRPGEFGAAQRKDAIDKAVASSSGDAGLAEKAKNRKKLEQG